MTLTWGRLIELKVTSSSAGHDPYPKSLDQDHDQIIFNKAFVSDPFIYIRRKYEAYTWHKCCPWLNEFDVNILSDCLTKNKISSSTVNIQNGIFAGYVNVRNKIKTICASIQKHLLMMSISGNVGGRFSLKGKPTFKWDNKLILVRGW